MQSRQEAVSNWLGNTDFRQQQIHVIENQILPYAKMANPENQLFINLVELKLTSLISNQLNIDAYKIYSLLAGFGSSKSDDKSASFQGIGTVHVNSDEFSAIVNMALLKPSVLMSSVREKLFPDWLGDLDLMVLARRNIIIFAHLGFPMGGGEAFLLDTCRVMSALGFRCVWINFQDPTIGWNTSSREIETPYFLDVSAPGPPSLSQLEKLLRKYRGDLIHAHGAMADIGIQLSSTTRVPSLIGYHFWTGLVDLHNFSNEGIVEHIRKHSLHDGPNDESNLVVRYLASEFMLDVVKGLGDTRHYQVFHPVPIEDSFKVTSSARSSLLIMNANPKKGGGLLYELFKYLPNSIVIDVVISEPGNYDFYAKLKSEAKKRGNVLFHNYTSAKKLYENARVVLAASDVDETFGRVVFESIANGIPVLTKPTGFISYMLGREAKYLPDSVEEVAKLIEGLFVSNSAAEDLANKQRAAMDQVVERNLFKFIEASISQVSLSPSRQIGIFTIWGDQGLGNQCREYSVGLMAQGFEVSIFSFQSYLSMGKGLKFQNNSDDWSSPTNADRVYYSFNNRESVTAHELREFIYAHNIGSLLVPEICWPINWNRLFSLHVGGLSIVGIPNLEICKKSEVKLHNRLQGTFFPTKQAEEVLVSKGVENGTWVGFGIDTTLNLKAGSQRKSDMKYIRYLHVAGANPLTRKNTIHIISAFEDALKIRQDIKLTITSLVPKKSVHPGVLHENIEYIESDFSRDEVHALYASHDVSIQVSSHEGIGLGFYESISVGCPVISLDVPPHNEPVIDQVSGWLISAEPTPMPDNREGIVNSWKFENRKLTSLLTRLERDEISTVALKAKGLYLNNFTRSQMLRRFINGIFDAQSKSAFYPRDENANSIAFGLFKALSSLARLKVAKFVPGRVQQHVYYFLRKRIERSRPEVI